MLSLKQTMGFLLFFVGIQSFGQGLQVEKAFNNNYHQVMQQLIVEDTTTYIVIQQFYSSASGTPSILYKVDADGTTLFEVEVEPNSGQVMQVLGIIPAEDGGLYLAGNSLLVCDVPEPTPFVQKYSAEGDILWTLELLDLDHAQFLSGFSLVKDTDLSYKLIFSTSSSADTHASSEIYMLNTDGVLLDTIAVTNNQFEHFELMVPDQLIASKEDSLFTFSFDGDLIQFREFNENIGQLVQKGDTLITLTQDSLSYLSTDFLTIDGVTFDEDLKSIRLYDDELYVQGTTLSEQHIYELDYGLTLASTVTIPFELPANHIAHFSKEQFSVGIPFDLTRRQAVRYLNFSLLTATDVILNRTDAGIIDIEILASEFNDWDQVNLYSKVLVKNYGTNELTSCRINHFLQMGFVCGVDYYTEVFTDLNIAPNDSAWIELGWTGFKNMVNIFGAPGDPEFNYCFYTSYVNELCDLNVPNDQYCRVLDGQLDLESNSAIAELQIYPNPFKSTFTIKNIPQGYSTFTLYDLVGHAVLTGVNNGEINASQLPAGVYMVELRGDNLKSLNQLVVKQ